jgi:hypothetical protein
VSWPIGPEYAAWVSEENDTARAWSMYTLRTAIWYIDLLEDLGARHGFLRLVGIEMALDGAVTALSSPFDAAVGGLINAAEERLQVQAKDSGTPAPTPIDPWKYTWQVARRYLQGGEVGQEPDTLKLSRAAIDEVEDALRTEPRVGWLQVLRRLRNRTTHQNTLSRHIDLRIGGADEGTDSQLSVDGQGRQPVEYLRETHERLHDLVTSTLLPIADHLAPRGLATSKLDTQSAAIRGNSTQGSAQAISGTAHVAPAPDRTRDAGT